TLRRAPRRLRNLRAEVPQKKVPSDPSGASRPARPLPRPFAPPRRDRRSRPVVASVASIRSPPARISPPPSPESQFPWLGLSPLQDQHLPFDTTAETSSSSGPAASLPPAPPGISAPRAASSKN